MKVLIYDIETSPNVSYTWGMYEQNVIKIKKEGEVLCFAYKWLDKKSVKVVSRADGRSEKELLQELRDLLDEADIVVAHNGNKFDNKVARGRFFVNGIKPPSPFVSVDTRALAKRFFRLNSNGLEAIGKLVKAGGKLQHSGFSLWEGCMRGDKSSWKLMESYNKQDVVLLQKVFNKLLPWIKQTHPGLTKALKEVL